MKKGGRSALAAFRVACIYPMSVIATDCAGAILFRGEERTTVGPTGPRGFSTPSEGQKRPVLWMGRISFTDFL